MKRDVQDAGGGDGLGVSVVRPCQTMRLSCLFAALSVAVVVGFFAQSVQAEIITFGYTGTLTSVTDRDNVLGGAVNVGDPIIGWYSFDSETPDAYPNHLPSGVYRDVGPMSITIGPVLAVTPADIKLTVTDDPAGLDSYELRRPTSAWFEYMGGWFTEFQLSFLDEQGVVFQSDALPLVPPDVSEFEQASFVIVYRPELDANSLTFSGTIDSLTLIPEPSNAAMLLLALCAGYGCRRTVAFRIT